MTTKYEIYYDSTGADIRYFKSDRAAKIFATQYIAFGCGCVTVTNFETGQIFRRTFWSSIGSFGWDNWKKLN